MKKPTKKVLRTSSDAGPHDGSPRGGRSALGEEGVVVVCVSFFGCGVSFFFFFFFFSVVFGCFCGFLVVFGGFCCVFFFFCGFWWLFVVLHWFWWCFLGLVGYLFVFFWVLWVCSRFFLWVWYVVLLNVFFFFLGFDGVFSWFCVRVVWCFLSLLVVYFRQFWGSFWYTWL